MMCDIVNVMGNFMSYVNAPFVPFSWIISSLIYPAPHSGRLLVSVLPEQCQFPHFLCYYCQDTDHIVLTVRVDKFKRPNHSVFPLAPFMLAEASVNK